MSEAYLVSPHKTSKIVSQKMCLWADISYARFQPRAQFFFLHLIFKLIKLEAKIMLCVVAKPCSISTAPRDYLWSTADQKLLPLHLLSLAHDCSWGNSQNPIPSEQSKIRELRNRIFRHVGFQNLCRLFGAFGL